MATYAFSDLHGNINLWHQIRDFLEKTNSTAYCLGDCADRGNDGWEIIKEILTVYKNRITYIRGNHDQMLIDRVHYATSDDIFLHEQNGGHTTFKALMRDYKKNRPFVLSIIDKLNHTPFYAIYNDIFLSHSGSTNVEDADSLLWQREFFEPHKYEWVIHGHTPIPYIDRTWDRVSPLFDTKLRMINIDAGAFTTGRAILYNLDDGNWIIFDQQKPIY